MRPQHISLSPDTADRNGIATDTLAEAGNFTLDGALCSGGVATMDIPRHVSFYSAGNNSAKTFTITGTNRFGDAMTETVTPGPNNSTVTGSKNFKTVTAVACDAATAGDVEVGSADELDTAAWLPDTHQGKINFSVNHSTTYTSNIKIVADNVHSGSWDQETAPWVTYSGDKTADHDGLTDMTPSAIRCELSSLTSGCTVEINFFQQRIS